MPRHILTAVAIAAVFSASPVLAQKVEPAPLPRTSPVDGPAMFASYCAPCHGVKGLGDGPAARALTKVPADLTRLATRNGGQFPTVRVRRYIEGADEVAAHGSRDMPMWGPLFKSLSRDMVVQRIETLTKYLEGLQQP
jgi:mono/diheme cytochrome c family protein